MAGGDGQLGTVSVLFTDVVGSTALRARIGEEAADALRVEHDAILDDAISSRGGTVVKHTGDGVMATFAAAANAVAAAVAIQQAIDSHNRRGTDEALEVRVGISVGDVTRDSDDYFGLPVIEAQRLEAAAQGGQILCAEVVRHLARGRGGHEFASVGDLELKGIPGTVPVVEILWEPIAQVTMRRDAPLPSVLATPSAFDLAGRDDELASLLDGWKLAADGQRRVAFVAGEPGIGKTRLAIEIARVARDQGALVLAGRCDEAVALPFQPFAEALRYQVERRDDAPTTWLGSLAGELVRLVPELPHLVRGLPAAQRSDLESERALLFDAVTRWLRTTASSVPVLLVLDDLQWAVRPTLQLLRHVLHETAYDSLYIVGTYRPNDLDRDHPLMTLVGDACRDGSATRIELSGLTAEGVTDLLRRAAGHDLDDAALGLADALFAETGGNPFFIGEIVRHLVERGALIVRDGRWTSDLTIDQIGLPETVRDAIHRRVAHLEGDAQRLLAVAAVIGYEFDLPVLALVAGVEEERSLDLLDVSRASGLVNEVGVDRYQFGHALVRGALLDEQSATRRVRTHRKIAETIEQLHADDLGTVVIDLAYHYGEAAGPNVDKALHYATLAGERAFATAAAGDAATWFTRALALVDEGAVDIGTRIILLTRRGQAAWTSGTGIGPADLLEAARLAKDAGLHHAMANALLVNVRQSYYLGIEADPEKIELLEYVLERLDGEPALRARIMGALARELVFVGDRTRRIPLLEQARELARASGDPLAIVDCALCDRDAMPMSYRTAETTEATAREYLAEVLAAAHALGDPYWISQMLCVQTIIAAVRHDGQEMRAAYAAMLELDDASPGLNVMRIIIPQTIATLEGRLVDADVLSVEVLRLRDVAPAEALAFTATMQLATRREQGRLADIVPMWIAVAAQGDVNATTGAGAATAAFVLAETGDRDAAAIRLHAASGDGFRDIPDDLSFPMAAAMWAEAAALVRDRECAARLHEVLTPFDGLNCATGGISCGPYARLLARLEDALDRSVDADRHFAEAIEQSRRLMSPVWIARSQLDWAASLLARQEIERAGELVDAADATIGTLTLPALQQQSAALRARLG
jgi:class 3 adenylate cyclase